MIGLVMMTALMFFGVQSADATAYVWVGNDAAWGTATNWNSIGASCGTVGDGAVPGVGDQAFFDSNCTDNVTIPAATSVIDIITQAGYTGTLTQAGTISVSDKITIVSGATLDSAGWTIDIAGDWTNGGIYTPGGGVVNFNGTVEQTVITGGMTGNFDFFDVKVSNSSDTVALSTNGMMVNNDLTIEYDAGLVIIGNDLTVSGTYANNDGQLLLLGTETVILTGGMDTNDGTTIFAAVDTGSGPYAMAGLSTLENTP